MILTLKLDQKTFFYVELIFEQEPTQRVDACPQNFAR